MAPKKKDKQKAPESDRATEPVQADRATEPVQADSTSQAGVNVKSLYKVAIQSAPDKDVALLTEVKLLGHYPRSLNYDSRSSATEERQAEAALYKLLGKRRKTLKPECLAYLDALKTEELGRSESRATKPN